jgi:DNA-binding transcriptional LysR family regulator
MDLRDLKYFVTIADQEHFGRASKQLRIAQPALSRRLKSLEREIGGDLFERLPRGFPRPLGPINFPISRRVEESLSLRPS